MGRFDATVTLVTGASRGIGLAIASQIVTEGGRVAITARGRESLDAAVAELDEVARTRSRSVEHPPASSVVAIGIAGKADDPQHRAHVFEQIHSTFGRLDHLVNNAGINPAYGKALDIDDSAVRKIMEVNVLGTLSWTRDAVAAGLAKSVVNIASIAGVTASPGIAMYGVSKAALINLTAQLAHELAPGIRVNAVAPAVIKTDFAKALYEGREEAVAAGYPLKRLGIPSDVAGPVAFLLSDESAWVTGQTLVIDGGGSLAPVL